MIDFQSPASALAETSFGQPKTAVASPPHACAPGGEGRGEGELNSKLKIQHSKQTPPRPCLADLARRNRMKAAALAKAGALNLRPATQKSPQFFKTMQGCASLRKAMQGVSGKKRF